MNRILLSATAMVLMSAGAAFAHHPLGGMTPQTAMHGFLSGVGHPVIGFDHLAFIIGVGLIAAFHRNKLAMPAAFVTGTVGGTHVDRLHCPEALGLGAPRCGPGYRQRPQPDDCR